MHFDLLDIIFSKTKRWSAAISDLTFARGRIHGDSLTSTDPGNIPFPDSATAWLGEHMNREHLNGSISVCNDVDVSMAAERCLFQKPGSWYDA
jgi:hypothetical protein